MFRSPKQTEVTPRKSDDVVRDSSVADAITPETRLGVDCESRLPKMRHITVKGPKRMATSPLKVPDEFSPSPLSDSDVRGIKEDLLAQDNIFTSFCISSKETVAKKKELEQIIAVYRNAVDLLLMAYMNVKSERETTLNIWRMMGAGGAGSGGDLRECMKGSCEMMKESLRDAVASIGDQIRDSVRDGLAAAAGAVHVGSVGGGRSYSSVVSARVEQHGVSIPAGLTARGKRLETIEIVPDKDKEAEFVDAAATMRAVRSAVDPSETGVKVDRLIKGRNKSVRVVAAPSELDKLKPMLDNLGMNVRQFGRLNPRLIIRDVPTDMDREAFVSCLISQNLRGLAVEDIKVIYRFSANGRKASSIVVEVSPEIRKRLMEQGRVYIGWASCYVSDHLRVTQCFRCLRFGHIAKDCSADKDTCGHCRGEHETRSCRNRKSVPTCHNCSVAKLSTVDHSALDAGRCPIIQRRLREREHRINY